MPRIQHKRGTSANLASVNPTPLAGELVWDSTENAIKIGDGATAWSSLAYVTATPRTHAHDGADITTGTVAYARLPVGSTTSTVCAGDDARLTDARTPTAHKSTHATGGSDALTPADIGAAPAASPAITGNATFEASSGVPVTITNTGTGNSFVVNDAAGDTTPFVVDADGRVGVGSSQTFGVPSRLHVADAGASATAVVTIQGTAAGTIASPLVPSSLVFRNFQFDTSAGNARQLVRIDALSREQAVATGAAVFYCSNSSSVATEYFRIDPHLNGCISALPVVAPVTTGSAGSYVVSFSLASDPNTGFGQVGGQSDTASVFTAGHERMRIRSDGNIGIGYAGAPTHRFSISGDINGTGTNLIYLAAGTAQPSVTTLFSYYSQPSVAAGTTLALIHFNAVQGTISGAVGSHYGFSCGDLDGSNVRGFSGNIAAGTNRHNLFMGGTAQNYLAGNLGIGVITPTAALDINSNTIRLRTAKTPASASDTGNAGDICWDANFVYVCTATNTWRKAALTADGTQAIANDSITYAKIQNVSATDRLLGRSSAGAGDIEEITCTAFGRSLIDDANAAAARGTLGAAPSENATFTGTTTFNGPVVESRVVGGNTGTAKTISLTNGTLQDYTLTGNCTFTLPSVAVGQSFTLLLRTGTGGYTATFTGVKWPGNSPPTVTTAANQLDIFTFVSDGGNWFGNFAKGYQP